MEHQILDILTVNRNLTAKVSNSSETRVSELEKRILIKPKTNIKIRNLQKLIVVEKFDSLEERIGRFGGTERHKKIFKI